MKSSDKKIVMLEKFMAPINKVLFWPAITVVFISSSYYLLNKNYLDFILATITFIGLLAWRSKNIVFRVLGVMAGFSATTFHILLPLYREIWQFIGDFIWGYF